MAARKRRRKTRKTRKTRRAVGGKKLTPALKRKIRKSALAIVRAMK